MSTKATTEKLCQYVCNMNNQKGNSEKTISSSFNILLNNKI